MVVVVSVCLCFGVCVCVCVVRSVRSNSCVCVSRVLVAVDGGCSVAVVSIAVVSVAVVSVAVVSAVGGVCVDEVVLCCGCPQCL